MELNFLELWATMGAIARGVVVVLLLMSCASLAIAAERWWSLRRAIADSRAFLAAWRERLGSHGFVAAGRAAADERPASPAARLVALGTAAFAASPDEAAGHEASRHAVRRAIVDTTGELKRGFGLVATVGSTAPFVGLFGTVVGIVNAFGRMAQTGQGGLGTVSAGIAEALVATALGILVAIPAVWLYNVLIQQAAQLLAVLESAGEEVAEVAHRSGRVREERRGHVA